MLLNVCRTSLWGQVAEREAAARRRPLALCFLASLVLPAVPPCPKSLAGEGALLTAEEDYALAKELVRKELGRRYDIEFPEAGWLRNFADPHRTGLPYVLVAVKARVSIGSRQRVPYQCLFSRVHKVTDSCQLTTDLSLLLVRTEAELLFLRVSDQTVYVHDRIQQLTAAPLTLARVKRFCALVDFPLRLAVEDEDGLEQTIQTGVLRRLTP